jgi:hypothetical protein
MERFVVLAVRAQRAFLVKTYTTRRVDCCDTGATLCACSKAEILQMGTALASTSQDTSSSKFSSVDPAHRQMQQWKSDRSRTATVSLAEGGISRVRVVERL